MRQSQADAGVIGFLLGMMVHASVMLCWFSSLTCNKGLEEMLNKEESGELENDQCKSLKQDQKRVLRKFNLKLFGQFPPTKRNRLLV